jgi:hypothetical protein
MTRFMSYRIGATVEDRTFLRPDGSALSLHSLAGKPLLLLFLRHLA